MSKVVVERFDGGMSDDRYEYAVGQSSVVKGFDILTYPHRLLPTRTTTTDAAVATGIGNLLVANDGIIYGLGADQSNPTTNSQLYKKADNATNWAALSNGKTGTSHLNFDLFVEYPDIGGVRTIVCAGNGGIALLDKANGSTVSTITSDANSVSLAYESLTQGIIHPKDDVLYLAYTVTGGGSYIISCNAGVWNARALTLPTALVVTSLSWYGNYLAIGCAPRGAFTMATTGKIPNNGLGGAFKSVVFLWDRDATLATLSETIDWGTGILQVLNNLNGRLIGISMLAGSLSSNIIDRNSILIKEYAGGVPQTLHEYSTERQTTTAPSVNINPYVNFIYRNRMYFSIDIVGGSTSPNLYGLWTIGKSNISNQYAVAIERGATTDNSETSVLSAAATGDYFSMVYTANGTTGFSINSSSLTVPYSATSYYESCVNPGMLLLRNTRMDFTLVKQLQAVSLAFYPLIAGQTVTLKYRVDSNIGATGTLGAGWTTIATYTSASYGNADTNSGFDRALRDAAGASFTSGRFYEFRIESIGGAQILELAYKFEILKTNMVD